MLHTVESTNVTIVGYLDYQCSFITVLAFAPMVTYVFGRYGYANAPYLSLCGYFLRCLLFVAVFLVL
jgi:hypothetical protein